MAARRSRSVLMTADTIGGVWSYAVELARGLDRLGIRVALATMGAPLTRDQRAQLTGLRSLSLFESSYKLEWMQRAWGDVESAGQWLLDLERELAPDLVHLNQFAFGALPFTAPTLVVAHSCVLSWWRAVHAGPAPAHWDRYRREVGRGLAAADLVAAPTRAMLSTLQQNYGYEQPGLVLSNGRSGAVFKPAAKQPCILAAGRLWDEGKNLAALECAAPQLTWPVRLAGSTSHPDGGSVLPAWVYCLGELPTPALAQQLSTAAIYALPARYEPFGLSVLEAGLSGCALVLGDIPSLREVWGNAALYVAPDDTPALQQTLARLIDDPAEIARLGAAARRRALHFTPERMTADYLAAYAALDPAFAAARPREVLCA